MNENEINEIAPFKGKIVRIDNEHHNLPIFGRLIEISPQFLTIERRDGRLTLIKRKAILSIEAVRNQNGSAVD
jgi:hypothetical protein